MGKRKFSDISKDTVLELKPIDWLLCEICSKRVYRYRECSKVGVYCSRDCYEILILSKKNDYLDSGNELSFSESIKRSENTDDLMNLE